MGTAPKNSSSSSFGFSMSRAFSDTGTALRNVLASSGRISAARAFRDTGTASWRPAFSWRRRAGWHTQVNALPQHLPTLTCNAVKNVWASSVLGSTSHAFSDMGTALKNVLASSVVAPTPRAFNDINRTGH